MKIVLTGSLGHVGKPLVELLARTSHKLTVISSNPERSRQIGALGATPAIGSLEDAEFLVRAFRGADVVYTMVPPADYTDHDLDVAGQVRQIASNLTGAVRSSGVKRVIHLSSIGAHMSSGSGLILAHREVELALDELKEVDITFMRPVGFYYNLYSFLRSIRQQGIIAANYGGDDPVEWVSPIDIAEAVGEELVNPTPERTGGGAAGRKVRYVASDELTCSETARILGEAIGKPDLQWVVVPDEQMRSGLVAAGVQPKIAEGLVEMYAAHHSGALAEDYYRHRPVLGKVKMRDFAKEFAAAYKAQEAD